MRCVYRVLCSLFLVRLRYFNNLRAASVGIASSPVNTSRDEYAKTNNSLNDRSIRNADGYLPPGEQTGLPRDLRRLLRRAQRHSPRAIRAVHLHLPVLRTDSQVLPGQVRRRPEGRGRADDPVHQPAGDLLADGARGGRGERAVGGSRVGDAVRVSRTITRRTMRTMYTTWTNWIQIHLIYLNLSEKELVPL